jgi:hypothetical protein
MTIKETINTGTTRYFDKDGKELTAEEYEKMQESASGPVGPTPQREVRSQKDKARN